ncbi:MAG: phosphodiesterase [Wenzhouxiangellaceae bacterium]
MTALRLLQLSDCHLAAEPGRSFRGVDPDAGLWRLSAAVKAFDPDVLVLTGDLSEDGSAAAYRRLAEWVQNFERRVWWLPGNHDDPAVMRPIFAGAGFDEGPVVEAGGWQFLLLDTRWPGDPGGELDEARLAAWDRVKPDRPLGVFMHHQPVPVGAHWIDKVGLRAPERLWSRVERGPAPAFIAFGHVHQRFRRACRNVECLACPSTAANSLPGTARFTPGELAPMARWFRLDVAGWRSGYLRPDRERWDG